MRRASDILTEEVFEVDFIDIVANYIYIYIPHPIIILS